MDNFLAVLSHELRTPLSSVLGWSKMLQSRDLSQDKIKYALQAILRGAQAESHLVDSLMDLSRIKSRKMHLLRAHEDGRFL